MSFLGMGAAGWGAVGSVLGGAGSLASAFGGGSSKESRSMDQLYRIYDWRNQARYLVEGAKKAGLHPLYAMGMPGVSHQAMSPYQVDRGERLGRALKGMGQIAGAFDREERNIRLDILREQHRAIKLENDQKQNSEPLDSSIPWEPAILGQSDSVMNKQKDSSVQVVPDRQLKHKIPGVSGGTHPFKTSFLDEYNYFHRLQSDRAAQSLEEDMAGKSRYYYREFAKFPKSWKGAFVRDKDFQDFVKKELGIARKLQKLPKHMKYVWDIGYAQPKAVNRKEVKGIYINPEVPLQVGIRIRRNQINYKGVTRDSIKKRMRSHPLYGRRARGNR